MSFITDTLNYRYPATLTEFGDLYSRVSVEPELSLDYYYRAALASEKRILEGSNSLSYAELITERESLIRMWEKCAENYRYLGYFDRAVESMEHLLKIVEIQYGREDENYRYYARQMWESEAESFGYGYINIAPPRSNMIKFEENTNIDLERAAYAVARLDSLDRDHTMTSEELYYRGMTYGNKLKDTATALKYVGEALEMLEAGDPDSCYTKEIYEDCIRYLYTDDERKLLDFYRGRAGFLQTEAIHWKLPAHFSTWLASSSGSAMQTLQNYSTAGHSRWRSVTITGMRKVIFTSLPVIFLKTATIPESPRITDV